MKNSTFYSFLFAILLSGISFNYVSAQKVDYLYSDFGGYWETGYWSRETNKILPDNDHNLLAFRYDHDGNGNAYLPKVYSTGVNDNLLNAHGVSFIPGNYRALPVQDEDVTGVTTESFYFGFGSMRDGSYSQYIPNFSIPPRISEILFSGAQGLNLGSAITNIPNTIPLTFNITSIVNFNFINDQIPDILVTQMALPNNVYDQIWFEDNNGNLIGTRLNINFTNSALTPSSGEWRIDFFYPNTGQVWSSGKNTTRTMRLWAVDISAFGINNLNAGSVKKIIYKLAGSSDPAFVAYNANLLDIRLEVNDDSAFTLVSSPVIIDVLDNDQHEPLSSGAMTIVTNPSNGSVVINLDNTITYTPSSGFVGTDTFIYQVCNNMGYCDTAVVTVLVSCNRDAISGTSTKSTPIGISTQATQKAGWPMTEKNGFIVLESKEKGFVITRTTEASIPTPVEGMLIYDTEVDCFKLFYNSSWHCISNVCDLVAN